MAKYTIESKIGEGGFAEVFRCFRDTDGREFAKKVLPEETGEDDEKRFLRFFLGRLRKFRGWS